MICILLIWYPKCSTCKKAYNYLKDNNYSFTCRDIVLDRLNEEELSTYISMSGKDINSFLNTSGMKYRELGLKDKKNSMSYSDKIKLLSSDGMLVKRPILVLNNKVLVGFNIKEWSEIDENN